MGNQPDHTNRGHAEFSPSSLKYVAACAGFKGRSGTNAAAEKGTRIHEALEVRDPSALHDEEEHDIYERMVEAEDTFLDKVIGDEERQEFNEIIVDVDLDGTATFGTCDRLTLYGEGKAVMGDYKTGVSVIDEPLENWQAKAYALGAFQKFKDLNEITFVFYIPVRGEVLSGVFKREDADELRRELTIVIKDGEEVRPQWEKGVPSLDKLEPTSNCRFCTYEDKCPALGAIVTEIATRVSDKYVPQGDIENTDDPEVMEQLWTVAKIVSNWATKIKSKAVSMAKDGVEFPSLRLKSMGTPRKCVDNKKLLEIAKDFDVAEEELLSIASFPLKKATDLAAKKAAKGTKGQVSQDFMDALSDASVIETNDERFTLS